MKRGVFFFLILLTCSCALNAKKRYESDYKSNFESYKFDNVVVCLKYSHPNDSENKRVYDLFFNAIMKNLNELGYKAERSNLPPTDVLKYIEFSNYPYTEMPSSFSYSKRYLDYIFKEYKTVIMIEIMAGYSHSTQTPNKFYIDNCSIKYAILDSDSHKVILAGPVPPYLKYHRPRNSNQRTENFNYYNKEIGKTIFGTTTEFSGYEMSEEEFIERVCRSLKSMMPSLIGK